MGKTPHLYDCGRAPDHCDSLRVYKMSLGSAVGRMEQIASQARS